MEQVQAGQCGGVAGGGGVRGGRGLQAVTTHSDAGLHFPPAAPAAGTPGKSCPTSPSPAAPSSAPAQHLGRAGKVTLSPSPLPPLLFPLPSPPPLFPLPLFPLPSFPSPHPLPSRVSPLPLPPPLPPEMGSGSRCTDIVTGNNPTFSLDRLPPSKASNSIGTGTPHCRFQPPAHDPLLRPKAWAWAGAGGNPRAELLPLPGPEPSGPCIGPGLSPSSLSFSVWA